jgi:hypothetical protein
MLSRVIDSNSRTRRLKVFIFPLKCNEMFVCYVTTYLVRAVTRCKILHFIKMTITIIIKDENKLTGGFISSKFRYLIPECLFLFSVCWKIFSNLDLSFLGLFFPYFLQFSRWFTNSRCGILKNVYVKDIRVTGGTSLRHNNTHRSCSGWKNSVWSR